MKQKLTNEICQKMKNHLSPAQTELLRDTLTHVFSDFGLNDSIEPDMESITEQNEHLIQLFIAAKKSKDVRIIHLSIIQTPSQVSAVPFRKVFVISRLMICVCIWIKEQTLILPYL